MIESLLEIKLKEKHDFLKIIETLTRIGLQSRDKKITQTCHILHKRGKYYITHFKEMFVLDGVQKSEISEEDLQRRNGIAKLIEEWGLCEIVDKQKAEPSTLQKIKVVPFSEKDQYVLKANYTIGSKKTR